MTKYMRFNQSLINSEMRWNKKLPLRSFVSM